MANPITSVRTTVHAETKILLDELPKQNDISDLASRTLVNTNGIADKPRKNITTILHRLPSATADTHAKGKSIITHPKCCLSDKCIKLLEQKGWKLDYEGMYGVNTINWQCRVFDELKAEFDHFDETQSIEIDKLHVEPKINYQDLPDFEDVKSTLIMMRDYKKFLKVLEVFGWEINFQNETYSNPQGFSYSLRNFEDALNRQNNIILAQVGNDESKLDQLFDSLKDRILLEIVDGAKNKLGLKYDKENNFFINGAMVQTVQDTTIRLTLMELKLM